MAPSGEGALGAWGACGGQINAGEGARAKPIVRAFHPIPLSPFVYRILF